MWPKTQANSIGPPNRLSRTAIARSRFARFRRCGRTSTMHIHGTTHIHGPHGVGGPHFAHRSQATPSAPQQEAADRVEISPAAEEAIRAAETGRVRQALVDSIRAQIAAGTYETPDKL